jgi:hypothetical protein
MRLYDLVVVARVQCAECVLLPALLVLQVPCCLACGKLRERCRSCVARVMMAMLAWSAPVRRRSAGQTSASGKKRKVSSKRVVLYVIEACWMLWRVVAMTACVWYGCTTARLWLVLKVGCMCGFTHNALCCRCRPWVCFALSGNCLLLLVVLLLLLCPDEAGWESPEDDDQEEEEGSGGERKKRKKDKHRDKKEKKEKKRDKKDKKEKRKRKDKGESEGAASDEEGQQQGEALHRGFLQHLLI